MGPIATGCSGGGDGQGSGMVTTVLVTPLPTASTPATDSAWVLSPIGVNMRSDAGTSAPVVATLRQGVQLDVLERRDAGGQAWLRVRGRGGSGADGWVADLPELVIHREITPYRDDQAAWSLEYPATWKLTPGNPATFVAPPGESPSASFSVQSATAVDGLAAAPASPGWRWREEGPVEVFGTTAFFTVYQLDAGGYEYSLRVSVADRRAFGMTFRQASGSPDTTLFRQLVAGFAVR